MRIVTGLRSGHVERLVNHRAGLGHRVQRDQRADAVQVSRDGFNRRLARSGDPASVEKFVTAARGPWNGDWVPERRFDVMFWVSSDTAVLSPPADAGERFHGVVVRNDAHLVVKLDGVAIEQLERFLPALPQRTSSPPCTLSRSNALDGRPSIT